jgi:integrase
MQGRVNPERLTMPVFRRKNGRWSYREQICKPNGKKVRIAGTAPKHRNTQGAAEDALKQHMERIQHPERAGVVEPAKVITFGEWFNGRFWREWVIAQKNKPTEIRSKQIIYRLHLEPRFKDTPLDEIDVSAIAQLRADLVEAKLSEKRINNILAVLSKPLHYAAECNVIAKVPRMGLFKCERPEIEAWDFAQYARLLAAAKAEGEDWYAAVCLAGEAGLRVGEVKALRWREDVDMIARTITVRQQTCNGVTTTPKGRTRRTVPMTTTLYDALKRMSVVREGFVVRNADGPQKTDGADGSQKTDGEANWWMARICRKAGLPVHYWHRLRHSYGTHAALFGVNPWRLQSWMGHKRIEETMLYVHVAETHARELPEKIRDAAIGEADPDARILRMLGARGIFVPPTEGSPNETVEVTAA